MWSPSMSCTREPQRIDAGLDLLLAVVLPLLRELHCPDDRGLLDLRVLQPGLRLSAVAFVSSAFAGHTVQTSLPFSSETLIA